MQKISVITPFYKGNQYVKGLFSVIASNQEYMKQNGMNMPVELIIVNDSPDVDVIVPDDTKNLVYKVVKHDVNGGIHKARVTGLCHSDGEYVLFLDQDDVILEEFMYEQLRLLGERDVVVANALLEQSDGSCKKLYESTYDLELVNNFEAYLKTKNQITSPGQSLIKRSVIPKAWTTHIMKTNGADDLFLWVLLLNAKRQFVLNPKCLYIHKYTGENLSASEAKMNYSTLDFIEILKEVQDFPSTYVETLKRNIDFRLLWEKSSTTKKVKLVWTYKDILAKRMSLKVKRIFARKQKRLQLS